MNRARAFSLVSFAVLGLVFLSRSCALPRASGPIALTNGRIVSVTGNDQAARVVIADGKIVAVSFYSGGASVGSAAPAAREVDVNELYIAAATFDRSAPTLIDGIRHVWVGQIAAGYPGDVVIMRSNPARVRAGYIPDSSDIAGAVVDGVYYSSRDLSRPPRSRHDLP